MATKKKAQEKTDIHANAMLVNLTIHFWRGRKHDRVSAPMRTTTPSMMRDATTRACSVGRLLRCGP